MNVSERQAQDTPEHHDDQQAQWEGRDAEHSPGTDTQEALRAHEQMMDDMEEAMGAYCEVRGKDNLLVTVGHIEQVERDKGAITLMPLEGEMPIVIFNTEFKLIIRPRGAVPVVIYGLICGSSKTIWKLDRLRRFRFKENRDFFRQPVDTRLYATCINELYRPALETEDAADEDSFIKQAQFCRVMDVSLQGIQLRAKEDCFAVGDWLLLTDLVLVPQQVRPHTFICEVCRTQPAGRSEFLFGCRFQLVSEHQQDALCSDIFFLHRRDIQSCRIG